MNLALLQVAHKSHHFPWYFTSNTQVESAQASVWLWIKNKLYPCPTRCCANNVSIPLAGCSVILLKSCSSWLCRIHSQGCHTLWRQHGPGLDVPAHPEETSRETAPWNSVIHRDSPDLEQAALAEKVSTFTESGKVFRANKISVCKLPAREHSENPRHNHKRLHQCYIMEICWDSFLFHFALSSPIINIFLPSLLNFALRGCFLCDYSLWHLCSIIFSSKASHSLINPFLCPLSPLFPSSPLANTQKDAVLCLCWKEGLSQAWWELSMFLQHSQKKGERVWDIDTRVINSLVQSFSSPYSKDQHKAIWINAEIFLGDRSTTPDMLNMKLIFTLLCPWPLWIFQTSCDFLVSW